MTMKAVRATVSSSHHRSHEHRHHHGRFHNAVDRILDSFEQGGRTIEDLRGELARLNLIDFSAFMSDHQPGSFEE